MDSLQQSCGISEAGIQSGKEKLFRLSIPSNYSSDGLALSPAYSQLSVSSGVIRMENTTQGTEWGGREVQKGKNKPLISPSHILPGLPALRSN